MKPIVSLLLVSAGICSSVAPASAIKYNNNSVYKATDNGNTVVVFSASAGSKIQVNLGTQSKPTAKIVGACGELKISVPSTGSFEGLKVDGTAVDASTLPTQTLPSCVSGSFAEPRPNNFKTPSGQVIIVGKTANTAASIELPQASTKSISVNACGFGVLKASSGQMLPATFKVDATEYTVASLPDATVAPYCRTIQGVSSGYVPAAWNP
ncbi:hypothetical protein ICL16_43120 [Iningainema sp. BLCCT55]|uniref:Uncharacterized protein n=1 Tax=Iningainema tapete BLCC-T55 TaxID=2748662 RepID=A0A8J6XSA9_9CYAN|nr:hypothetical protein [Iningainema tapete BLCC-T55]